VNERAIDAGDRDGIELGEVRRIEEAVPTVRWPHEDGHAMTYCVGDERAIAALRPSSPASALDGASDPRALELDFTDPSKIRIFVQHAVWRELIDHATSDVRVELGGLLVGRRGPDALGRPCVWVRDALRARHYYATRGSFTFTHDTWADLSSQRAALPRDTVVLGWYHTHPDWGVFLSGMDRFICENFFADAMDVALVIDPIRHRAGWFQWQKLQPRLALQELDRFWLTDHRLHQARLLNASADLFGEEWNMPDGSSGRPMVISVPSSDDRWHRYAMLAMLAGQCLLILLLAFRLLLPATEASTDRDDLRPALAAVEAREATVDQLLVKIGEGSDAAVAHLRSLQQSNDQLQTANSGLMAKVAAMEADHQSQQRTLLDQWRAREQSLTQALEAASGPKTEAASATAKGAVDPIVQWFEWRTALSTLSIVGVAWLVYGWWIQRRSPGHARESLVDGGASS
jgi:proteasome lid subunit RPN8/RPN11